MCDVQGTHLLNKERAHNLKMTWLHVSEIKINKVSVYRKRYVNELYTHNAFLQWRARSKNACSALHFPVDNDINSTKKHIS